jgi:hypothetical protein
MSGEVTFCGKLLRAVGDNKAEHKGYKRAFNSTFRDIVEKCRAARGACETN